MRIHLKSCLRTAALLAAGMGVPNLAIASNWITNASGDYHTAGNWSAGVPNAAGAIADFSTLDFSGDIRVTMDAPVTVGQLDFGDTNNPGSPTSWELFSTNASALTLDNSGVAPVINVDPLGITPGLMVDDAFIGVPVTSTLGLTKTGNGILTFNAPTTISGGNYTISGGHLRFLAPATQTPNTLPYIMSPGTTLSVGGFIAEVAASAGGTVTVNQTNAGANQFMQNFHGAGTGESLVLNLSGGSGRVHSMERDWGAANGAWANVTISGADGADNDPLTAPVQIRARSNAGGGGANNWNANSFANTALTLNNVRFFSTTFSGGTNFNIGSLSGNIDSVFAGGGSGSAARYIVGGLNTNTTFAGLLDGAGGQTINKVGTGTLTLSGGVTATTPVLAGNTDPGRQGGVFRVTSGTLATSGTFDHFAGGAGLVNSTVDVKPGAVLDVSGSTNFHSVPLQQFIGTGTIRGSFDHQGGNINAADTGVVDNDTDLTNVLVPTAGTITFDGNLSFNGGTIVFDMNPTPGGDDLVSVTGTTNLGTGGIVKPNFLAGTPAPGQTYTFLNSAGGFTGSTTGWTVAWPGRGTPPTVSQVGNTLRFTSAPIVGGATLVWTGAANANWDINASTNWLNGAVPDKYFDGDAVQFTEAGNNTTINIVANVAPPSIVVDSTTKNYSFSGSSILTTGTLTKRGSSTLTLGMVNEFAGGVTVEGGAINIGTMTGALGTGPMTLSGGSIVTSGGALNNNGVAVTAATNNTIQADSAAGGSGNVFELPALTGDGNLTINSAIDDKWFGSGATAAFTGTLTVGPNGAATQLGNFRGRGGQTTFPNAVVNLNSVTFTNQAGTSATEVTFEFGELHGNATAILHSFVGGGSAPADTVWEIGNLGTNSDFAGIIEDGTGGAATASASNVTKVGAGTLTLTGFNTYTGDTRVEGGTLSITQAYLADLADVFVDAGSVFDLNTGGTSDVIDSLYLGNTPQNPGTYGAVGSGATFQSAFFSGTGILQVTTLGAPVTTPGDFDNDGDVDGRDFLVWQRGGSPTPLSAADLATWQANYGTGPLVAELSTTSVPEPTGAVLAIACGFAVLAWRKRG
jgi:fibronectin-binding autotransporter adhesin